MNSYKTFLFLISFLFSSCLFSNYEVNDTIIPLKDFYPTTHADTIIEHNYYTVSYSFKFKNPEWTIYEYKENTTDYPRNNNFSPDPKIKNTATNKDFLKSGYDKGHLVPAEDMDFNKKSMDESFYLSNISPQNPFFNRGVWKKLENFIRHLGKNNNLIIITGTIISDDCKVIGNNVKIPNYFYKIIIDRRSLKTICFLIPNKDVNDTLDKYRVSIGILEEKTNLDFNNMLHNKN